ncbi:hypothetical protein HG15A2_40060 [Adhaeretor mobilis]|uniref:Uncharacterized protein n=2 Tax=Adhaeretor mobilis TaxID=1930276 RepID=A0A517N0L0_9BACT|nr:hypothetical protein HG15A2_40060 [Adhaeretor mobilis]
MAQQQQQAPPPAIDSAEVESAREVMREQGQDFTLVEMTRIMDVASTLRREQALVEQQLNIDQVKAKLRERLLAAAEVSGDSISAEQVDVAVEHYYDRLHTYQDPPFGLGTALAHVYVRRGTIMKWAIAIGAVVAIFWGLLAGGFFPGERRDAKLANQAYERLEETNEAIRQVTNNSSIEKEAAATLATAKALREEGDYQALEGLIAKQQLLAQTLMQQYELTIPSVPGQESAFPMDYTDANSQTVRSGYYVVVEAKAADGTPVRVQVRDRQTGKMTTTSKWAEQVPAAVYNRLKEDKQADGLLDDRLFGVKQRGERDLEVRMQGDSGVLDRGGQLTEW